MCVSVLSRCLLYFVGYSQFWISIFATSVSVCTVILDRPNFSLKMTIFLILCWLFVDWVLNFCWPSRNFYGHRNFYQSNTSFDLGNFLKIFDFWIFLNFHFFRIIDFLKFWKTFVFLNIFDFWSADVEFLMTKRWILLTRRWMLEKIQFFAEQIFDIFTFMKIFEFLEISGNS